MGALSGQPLYYLRRVLKAMKSSGKERGEFQKRGEARFLDTSERRLRSGQIGTFDRSDIVSRNITLHLRCAAEPFFSIFTGHFPKIIVFLPEKTIENYQLKI